LQAYFNKFHVNLFTILLISTNFDKNAYMTILNKEKLILASKSPRRKALLEQASVTFDIIISSIDEDNIVEEDPVKLVSALSRLKADDIAQKNPGRWVLGADTIVCLEKSILGKPDSQDHAGQMLRSLSNREHKVHTGITLLCREKNKIITEVVTTDVLFKKLSEKEIAWYINTKEYTDKAGAYAIQGKSSFFIKKIKGSYTNVVGLPLCEVMSHLISENIIKF